MPAQAVKFLILLLLITVSATGQSRQDKHLADLHYSNGAYEKALTLYKPIFKENPGSGSIYHKYLNCLLQLEQYEDAEQMLRQQVKRFPSKLAYHVDLGHVYELQDKGRQAQKSYAEAIEQLEDYPRSMSSLAAAFERRGKTDQAIQTYEKGRSYTRDPKAFDMDLARLYGKQGSIEQMTEIYLDVLRYDTERMQKIKEVFQDRLTNAETQNILRDKLYKRIQQHPSHRVYPEMLIWLLVQQRDFEAAFIQARALDKRFNRQGERMLEFARMAAENLAYEVALQAYDYVLEAGTQHLQFSAYMEKLDTKKDKITRIKTYQPEDLQALVDDYNAFLSNYGRNPNTAPTMKELAELKAFYLDDTEGAKALLDEITSMPRISASLKAECKLTLGDIHLVNGKVWDASLLYSQVEKDHQEDQVGHKARFKNAKVYYYTGDFEWAQAQLKVIKGTTTSLIANDALEMDVFITDNLGLDTVTTPMRMFAEADLYMRQNKDAEANAILDKILDRYPRHALTDHIYFRKAELHMERGNYEAAIPLLEMVVEVDPQDILADDAIFVMAEIYDKHLDDPEQARDLYERLVLDYSDSIYAVSARKRYRELRRETVN